MIHRTYGDERQKTNHFEDQVQIRSPELFFISNDYRIGVSLWLGPDGRSCSVHEFILQIAKFNKAAKVVQARYGVNNRAAVVDRPQKLTAVAAIASQRIRISPNAKPGLRIPKKMADQLTLSMSCSPKSPSDTREARQPPRRHTSHAERAIRKYSAVQTGPKSQSGGVQLGFFSV